MQTLQPENFYLVEALFQGMSDHLAVPAVLSCTTPGEVFVDDGRAPRCALMRVHHRFYLAGSPDLTAFNRSLHHLFVEKIYPQAGGEGGFTFYFDGGWADPVAKSILAGFDPIFDQRKYYRLQLDHPSLHYEVLQPPEGFTLREVDRDLLEDKTLGNLDELLEEIVSERASIAEFLERSFGTVLLHEHQVAGWCLSEYNLGERCEVGIATADEYHRRGLATIMGYTFHKQAFQRGIRMVGWHCRGSNKASSGTAIKLGYQPVKEYPSYFALYDAAANLALHGDILLDQANYEEALPWLERSIQTGSAPIWAYIDAAIACVGMTREAAAFDFLKTSIALGFDNLKWLQANPQFKCLQDLPEWNAMVVKVSGQ